MRRKKEKIGGRKGIKRGARKVIGFSDIRRGGVITLRVSRESTNSRDRKSW